MSGGSTFLQKLEWRYATKSFDVNRPVAESDVRSILKAIRMAPTSFGLQPFRVEIVTKNEIKEAIRKEGWNQPQYTTASHVLCFITRTKVKERIDSYFQIASGGSSEARLKLKGYEQMMKDALEPRSVEDLKKWAARQTYIALGFAMAACAELGVDSCPMEGFSPPAVDKILGLDASENTVVILPIGYREVGTTVRPKVRFPDEDLFSWK